MDATLGFLGLARRAGAVSIGSFLAEQSVRSGRGFLVIAAADAADGAKKKLRNACITYHVPYAEYANKAELGSCLGKDPLAAVCINDASFAQGILERIPAGVPAGN